MKLQINDSYHISDITLSDKAAYLEHLQEKQIYDQTLAIPFPYTEADADWWINHNIEATAKQGGRSVNWAIRRSDNDALIGGIGFLGLTIGEDHKAELGYWLAKPYEQAKRCLDIIEKAILPLGASRKDIIRTRIFVTDISKWQEFGRAHGEFFADHPPATTMVEVKALIDPEMLVEIEADAVLSEVQL